MIHLNSVNNLINCLTSDEDKRQQLWIHYLNGNPTESFSAYLDKINSESAAERTVQEKLHEFYSSPSYTGFTKLLANFSDFEKSILVLLVLGLSVSKISEYKGISEIRIKQVISIIRDNQCWRQLNGAKKEIDSR